MSGISFAHLRKKMPSSLTFFAQPYLDGGRFIQTGGRF